MITLPMSSIALKPGRSPLHFITYRGFSLLHIQDILDDADRYGISGATSHISSFYSMEVRVLSVHGYVSFC